MAHLTPELLAVLRCPTTGSSLVQEGDELVATGRTAAGERLRYPIEDGIPVLLPQAAVGADASDSTPDGPADNA
ncbi:hypothetical protein E4J89_01515 [Arthrobacter sp. CAU 1506]|uniref:Trm112 family protein n=1 Tax=Arthrobacter sp. CAU 1506 TaxID=2560052 RepID=UPI0010AC8DAA|nr:hypothetical protein [Arthrobacter sp. CAU 1506]TJY72396.1 hypothetical protein E4J89_01515 [Arthrobacter sp. CAU 1506]